MRGEKEIKLSFTLSDACGEILLDRGKKVRTKWVECRKEAASLKCLSGEGIFHQQEFKVVAYLCVQGSHSDR